MPEPTNLSQLRAWLGLANYYRRFVRGMAVLVAPLTALMAKGAEFHISYEQRKSMRAVNEALALHTVMRYPDYAAAASGERPFILATDACKEGFGAVLSQVDADGVEQPIAFTSRATLPNERNWSTTDLEAGAIVNGIKKFRHMLWGTRFTLLTDHRALQYMESIRERTARGGRWAEFLSAFDIDVVYKKGADHGNADGPSRNPLPASAADAAEASRERLLHAYGLEATDAHRLEALATGEHLHICMLIVDTLCGGGSEELLAAQEAEGASPAACEAFAEHAELGRLTPSDWQREQRADAQLGALWGYMVDGKLPADAALAAQVKTWSAECSLHAYGDCLLLVHRDAGGLEQIVVPRSLRALVMDAFHGSTWAGHQGTKRTMERVRAHCWWPNWTRTVSYWVSHCWPCQAYKRTGKLSRHPLVWRDLPPYPFHTIAIDHFGPLPLSSSGHSYVLVVMDMYSGWVWCYPITPDDFNSVGTARILIDQHSPLHGTPAKLLSDRGSIFMSALAKAFYHYMGIRKLNTTAYHPECNGKCERFMQELAQMLAMAVSDGGGDWADWLPHVSFAHNTSYNRATGATPYLLATGREAHYALHQLLGDLQKPLAPAGTSPSALELVHELTQRQRVAHGVASLRHALRRARVLRENDALASALGLRTAYKTGDSVWYYHAPRTHSAPTDIDMDPQSVKFGQALRTLFSKKLLDRWQGPYRVLAVGPGEFQAKPVQAGVLVVELPEGPTRVARALVKLCRDPSTATNEGPPGTLPAGFAKYLLAKHWHGMSPGPLTTDDVVPDEARHGVEAILRHRVATQARGRGQRLEYLVRWEGEVADSWESALNLDACATALHEYWATLSRAADLRSDVNIAGAGTEVVRRAMQKASKRRGVGGVLAQCGRGSYELAPGARAVISAPSEAVLFSAAVCGMMVMVVFNMTGDDGVVYQQWFEGEVVRVVEPGSTRTRSSRSVRKLRVFWVEEGKYAELPFAVDKYGTEPTAANGTWFLAGTQAQVDALTSIAQ